MAALTSDQIADLVLTTQRNLGRLKWTEIATDLQDHIALSQLLRKERVAFTGGRGFQKNLMYRHSDQAEHTGLFETATVNVTDVLAQINVPPRFTNTKWAYDEREEAMNSGPARLVDLLKVRRTDAMIALAEKIEQTFWNQIDLTTNVKSPWGIRYWFPRYTGSSTALGFNGQNPHDAAGTEYADCAGIDASLSKYSRWRSYTGQYTNVTKQDLIRSMREMFNYIKFHSPTKHPANERGGDRYGIYMNYDVLAPMEEAAEAQNDKLGKNVASMDGVTVFRRIPLTWVPQLDSDAGAPVYMINWSTFFAFFIKGWYLREKKPVDAPNQPNVKHNWIDLIWNTGCVNRRKNGVLSKTNDINA